MPWFAVYDIATGELRSSGSVVAETLPEGWAAKEFQERPDQSLGWNPATLDWDVPRPVQASVVSAVEFMQLFTVQERIAIRSSGDPILDDFLDMVRVAGTISMAHPMVVQGLGYLVQQAIITQARADEIGGS